MFVPVYEIAIVFLFTYLENARSKIKKIQRLLAWFLRRAPYVRFHTFIISYLTTVSNGHEYFISVTLTTCSD